MAKSAARRHGMTDTIFALSSGAPPAAIAVIRVSGPAAAAALVALAGPLPAPRTISMRRLHDPGSRLELDRTLVVWAPAPATATGEDICELHLHGGRAVVAAVENALGALPGLRAAQPGEFTRRAFANGRLDLSEAEGLADLLAAETELQRRSAQAMAGGELSRAVETWRQQLLAISARLEASIDFSDEADVGTGGEGGAASLSPELSAACGDLANDLGEWLTRPRAELLREGFRVVLAGPPNAGKSTLFNALVEHEAAITAPEAGTTRDVLTRTVALQGVPFTFIDTAGLRENGAGEVERIGIARARTELENADLVLWLGAEGEGPPGAWEIATQIDRADAVSKRFARHRVSALTGDGLPQLRAGLIEHARTAMPIPGAAALNGRQHGLLDEAAQALHHASLHSDPLLAAEELRLARNALDKLVGRAGTEDMLDALFGRFCIGK